MSVAVGQRVSLRRIGAGDLAQAAPHQYTLSIQEPLTDPARLAEAFAATGFWTDDAGAVAITAEGRLVGTLPPAADHRDLERRLGALGGSLRLRARRHPAPRRLQLRTAGGLLPLRADPGLG